MRQEVETGRRKIKVDSVARAFSARVKRKFRPARVISFGSRARGEEFLYSDYDFIIVSDSFKGLHWLNRISEVVGLWDSDRAVDVLPYTSEEFDLKRKVSSSVRAALQICVEV